MDGSSKPTTVKVTAPIAKGTSNLFNTLILLFITYPFLIEAELF